MPDYSGWLAHRHPEDLAKDDLSPSFVELWSQAHRLTAELERGGDAGAAKTLKGRMLASRYDEVVQRFAEQTRRFSSDRLREDCQAATAAAAVAFSDSRELSLRNALWDRLETIRKHDLEVAAKGETAEPSADDRKQAIALLRRRARIQGSMAVAALGESWFNDPMFKDQEQLERTGRHLLTSIEEDDEAAKSWWKEIAVAGDAIGGRWQRIEPEIASLTDDDSRSRELPVFQDRLKRAGRLGRIIDGGAPSLPESEPEAAALERQTRVHDLLVWLARRNWLDHWYDEDPKAVKPFYRTVGLRLASDAAKLVEKSPEVSKIRQVLGQDDKLRLDGPSLLALTSERVSDLNYRIAADGKEDQIPPGLPVVAPSADAEIKLEGENTGYRVAPWHAGGESLRFSIFSPLVRGAEKNANLTRPRMSLSQLSVTGFFRGQLFESRTPIELHPQPDQVAIGLPPAGESRPASRFGPAEISSGGTAREPARSPSFWTAREACEPEPLEAGRRSMRPRKP